MSSQEEGGNAPARAEAPAQPKRRVYCDCCRRWSLHAGFAIAPAAGGNMRRVCTRCASHIALKANGSIWLPDGCPDAPRPRLRVYHGAEDSLLKGVAR